MKLPENEQPPMSNPSDEHSKGVINDVLNHKPPEPEEPEPEVEPPLLVVKEVIPDEDVFNDVPPPEKRPKKKASAKQLEHLAKAREKAKENRRLKAEAKAQAKKDLKINQKPRRQSVTFDDDVDDDVATKDTPHVETIQSFQQFSREDIIKLQEEAINGYDTKRKARKEVKKKQQQQAAVEKKNYEAVTRAIHNPQNPQDDDPWAMCFN